MSTDSMNNDNDFDSRDFDASLRRHHAQAVASLSGRTEAQLLLRRRAASAPIRHAPLRYAWPLAAAGAVGMLAVGLQWRPFGVKVSPATSVVATQGSTNTAGEPADGEFEAYAMLDEAPDLYLWLASNDAATLAME